MYESTVDGGVPLLYGADIHVEDNVAVTSSSDASEQVMRLCGSLGIWQARAVTAIQYLKALTKTGIVHLR